jgi:hypothetical protein
MSNHARYLKANGDDFADLEDWIDDDTGLDPDVNQEIAHIMKEKWKDNLLAAEMDDYDNAGMEFGDDCSGDECNSADDDLEADDDELLSDDNESDSNESDSEIDQEETDRNSDDSSENETDCNSDDSSENDSNDSSEFSDSVIDSNVEEGTSEDLS